MKFYIGLHCPGHASSFARAFISVNRVRTRKSRVPCQDWILDSGAFSELENFGRYRNSPEQYAETVNRLAWANSGMRTAVSQDWMCERFMLERTGLTIPEHQRRTIERYDVIVRLVKNCYVMPVLQGYDVQDYLKHLADYGERLAPNAYVGVGSVCKRNGVKPAEVMSILLALKNARPDLRLHGFGLKKTCLAEGLIRDALYSADSMAWSFAARIQGRDQNSVKEARRFADHIERMPVQEGWPFQ